MHGLSERSMSNTTKTFLLLTPIFLLLIIFFYSSFFHQKFSNFSALPTKNSPPPSNNQPINITIQTHVNNNFTSSVSSVSKNLPQMTAPTASKIVSGPTIGEEKGTMLKKKMKKKSSLEKIEEGLARARAAIREAIRSRNYTSEKEETFIPRGPIYNNPYAFHQSHIEMERTFKIWTYKEGDTPLVHEGQLQGLYALEGHFIEEMEGGGRAASQSNKFAARHPNEAQVFFLPFSIAKIVDLFYRPVVTYSQAPIHNVVLDYIKVVTERYPYWNRSLGADHFMLSCHDWGPHVSKANPKLFSNLIRALCNANSSEGFQPKRDVSIPELNINHGALGPPSLGLKLSKRQIFAFFSGQLHGHIRKFLFEHWKDKNDEDIQVFERLPKHENYFKKLGQSKFCLCPSGYEVASPRVIEAIFAECVPVIIKDNYSFPFSDVLDWSKFSIYVPVSRIPEIKVILKGISTQRYMRLLKGVKSVKWHFTLNRPSKPFDLIHMILHSIWLRRLNIQLPYEG